MASVETTGPTVDDAIDAALEKLDLDEDQVDLEILSEGGDGQPARVRATPRSEVAEGTLAVVVLCVLAGARIVRVHDVRAVRRALSMTEAVLGWRAPAVLRHNV